MKLVIDNLDSATGWVVNAPSTIQEIEFKNLIAGLNSKSLQINFDSADTIRTATKTFATPYDVTEYNTLIMSIWSESKGSGGLYIKPANFSYKIDIDGVKEFYIPVHEIFTDIEIGIEDVTSITQIKITPLHSDTDTIVISEMIAELEEIPLDILEAVKEHIDYYIEQSQGSGIQIGTVTTAPGDTSITLSNPDYLDRYGVVLIDDGVNNETHQVTDNNAGTFQLNDNYDGNSIINTFTDASIYLTFPTYINPGQYEIRLPGISIWGIEPEPILRGGKLDTQRDTWQASGESKERTEGQILKYSILMTCESRSQELIDIMTRAIRKLIARESLWINGRRHDIYFSGPPTELPGNTTGIDYIPKVQYSLDVEVRENIYDRQAVQPVSTQNITVESVDQGAI